MKLQQNGYVLKAPTLLSTTMFSDFRSALYSVKQPKIFATSEINGHYLIIGRSATVRQKELRLALHSTPRVLGNPSGLGMACEY